MFFAPQLKTFRSSTFRLALTYMGLFLISVLLLFGFIYWFTAAYMVRQTDATIETEISGLAERHTLAGLSGLSAQLKERLSRRPAGSAIYLLTDPGYKPLVGNLDHWPKPTPTKNGWLNFKLTGQHWPKGNEHWARARTFVLEGGFHLLVGRDVHDLQEAEERIVKILAWGLGITVILALAGGLMMSRSIVRRIEAVNATCRDIMFGDLSRRIATRGSGDDFDKLADNFNGMLDRVGHLMEGVRQVSDNIAHDLRTPLARLRNRLEQLKGVHGGDSSGQEILDQAFAEADGLLSTFGALLRISRIEAGSREAGFVDLDLAAILQDVGELYEPLAEEKEQHLEVLLESPGRIRGDRNLLFQALANLLDNAIKYTPAGGCIRVLLSDSSRGVNVLVADSGPGIPAPLRQKVFQRFFRLEASRSTPGNGLGLSLVAAVASLHRARVHLEDNRPGLRAVLTFPVAGTSLPPEGAGGPPV
jgi:signal transduction histidine kinase